MPRLPRSQALGIGADGAPSRGLRCIAIALQGPTRPIGRCPQAHPPPRARRRSRRPGATTTGARGHALWIQGGGPSRDRSRESLPQPEFVEARKVAPVGVDRDGDLDLVSLNLGPLVILSNDGQVRSGR